ncbi:MAG: hypothetical protein WA265_13625 [Rhodomicrobium sp.]
MTTEMVAIRAADSSEAQPGGQGRVKNPAQDRRFARNRAGPTGQGRVQDRFSDGRLAQNRALKSTDSSRRWLLDDGDMAATVSAYLDGNLTGAKLAAFEAILDEAFSQELALVRPINDQLKEIGADILAEPIPAFLLEALSPQARL